MTAGIGKQQQIHDPTQYYSRFINKNADQAIKMFLLDRIVPYIFAYIRPFIKWFLHTFTRLCELQRLCYGAKSGASRTRQIERSLMLSKNAEITNIRQELDAIAERCRQNELEEFTPHVVMLVQRVKNIKARSHPDFGPLFGECVSHIWSYRRLMHMVERLRATTYDADNLEHEHKLLELWARLMPEEPLTGRVSKQWQEIGFQGDDPKTDFRGMGILGLDQLLFFSCEHNTAAQHVLRRSMHPVLGYTFAIVGINLTSLAYRLLKSGDAKTHFYNVAQAGKHPCVLTDFHKFYCFLFFEFDKFWFECEPTNIMDFRDIYRQFEITILEALHNDGTMFKTNLVVDQI